MLRRSTVTSLGAVLVGGLSALGFLALVSPAPAGAHGIQSTLERVQSVTDGLMLSSAFSSGEPTANAAVRLVPPGGGSPIEVGRTNASGQLSFALPKGANGDWEVQVDGGPGHRDYLDMPVRQGRAQLDKLSHAIDTPWRLDRATALAAGGAALAGVVAQGWGRRKTLDRG